MGMLAPNGLKKRHIFESRLKIFSNERTGNYRCEEWEGWNGLKSKVDIAGVDMNISEIFENSIVNSLELLVECFN